MENVELLRARTFQKAVEAVCPCRPWWSVYEINALLSVLPQDPVGGQRIKLVFGKIVGCGR